MRSAIVFSFLCILALIVFACSDSGKNEKQKVVSAETYLNHNDSVKYVGMNTCRQCHQSIYNSFIRTGMGKSFDLATRQKSAGDFSKADVYDQFSDLHYHAYWSNDSMYVKEFRVKGKDTVHKRDEKVSFIIGSGQHTNSHLQSVNGYLCQMPMTFYTQKKKWDLPPGFENGVNTRFSRKIGLECMSCHNSYPDFVEGSENKYRSVALGIGCERCHGPGAAHVAERMSGSRVDTSKYIDYSIVNPSKLPLDLQFDVCQRCHLQGNAVLKEGRSFYDFKPGMKLSEYMSVFLPKYKGADEEFIMASHADRLKQSECFIQSAKNQIRTNALRPAASALSCITCHNPHVSVRETNPNVFNDACLRCHGNENSKIAQMHPGTKIKSRDNCVSCHMPKSGSTDIPHVTVHDHYIRKPLSKKDKDQIREFVGLYAVNDRQPDALIRARAYIDQYDKFDHQPYYLDSAAKILKSISSPEKKFHTTLHLNFVKGDHRSSIALVNALGEARCQQLISKTSLDNRDAWSAYRIAEAYSFEGNGTAALKWFKKASGLAPYNLEFRNKLGNAYAGANDLKKAAEQFEFIMAEDPRIVSAYANLGYIRLSLGFQAEALRLYNIGYKLDPDNETLLLNLSAFYLMNKDFATARKYLVQLLEKHPDNEKAKAALEMIKKTHV